MGKGRCVISDDTSIVGLDIKGGKVSCFRARQIVLSLIDLPDSAASRYLVLPLIIVLYHVDLWR